MKKPGKAFVLGCFSGFLLGAVAAVVLLIGGALLYQKQIIAAKSKQLEAPPITTGVQADYNWTLQEIDGDELNMRDTAGKTVFLHFWHPECLICLSEIPALNRFHENMGGKITMIPVVFGKEDAIVQCLAEEDIRYPVYRMKGERPEIYDADSTPATFVIAPDGEIVYRHVGGAKWDDPAFAAFLEMTSQRVKE